MTRIEFAPAVADDVDRIVEHLEAHGVDAPGARIGEIIDALAILEHSPLIGRPTPGGKRELVIGRRAQGYLALYRHVAEIDTVFVLALRSQREAGYDHD